MPGDVEGLSICGGFQPEDALLPNGTELSLEIDVSVAWKSAPIRKDQEFKDSDTSQKSQKQPSLVRPGSHAPEIHGLQCEAFLIMVIMVLIVSGNQSRGGRDVFQSEHYSTTVRGGKEKMTEQRLGSHGGREHCCSSCEV